MRNSIEKRKNKVTKVFIKVMLKKWVGLENHLLHFQDLEVAWIRHS